ncbi:hypothetical protein [Nocardioides sp. NPDC006273]
MTSTCMPDMTTQDISTRRMKVMATMPAMATMGDTPGTAVG